MDEIKVWEGATILKTVYTLEYENGGWWITAKYTDSLNLTRVPVNVKDVRNFIKQKRVQQ